MAVRARFAEALTRFDQASSDETGLAAALASQRRYWRGHADELAMLARLAQAEQGSAS